MDIALKAIGHSLDRHGSVERAKSNGHGSREVRHGSFQAGRILVVIPVKGLHNIGDKVGRPRGDADGKIDSDGSCGWAASGGARGEEGAEPGSDAEHGPRGDEVGGVVGSSKGDRNWRVIGCGEDSCIECGGRDSLPQSAICDGGTEVLQAVLQCALLGPWIIVQGWAILRFGPHEDEL